MSSHVLRMFNKMRYQPSLSLITNFKKLSLPIVCNFFFGITLRYLTGRSFGLNKAKLRFYAFMVILYYRLNVDYASLIWVEVASLIKNYKKSIEVSSTRFWSLILHEVSSQESVPIPEDSEIATFSQLHIPKSTTEDPIMFPTVGCTSDAILNVVSPTNKLLIQ